MGIEHPTKHRGRGEAVGSYLSALSNLTDYSGTIFHETLPKRLVVKAVLGLLKVNVSD